MNNIRRALVSVWDKTGVVEFCRRLTALGFEIVATDGTLRALSDGGIAARRVSEVTGVPEILQGRVKTLHPVIFAGIMGRRDQAADLDTLNEYGIEPIDVVAVNLSPFAHGTVDAAEGADDDRLIDRIDIGGPALLRAAAKNFRDVYVVVDPADYAAVLRALDSRREADNTFLRRRLAAKVFSHTIRLDQEIRRCLDESVRRDEEDKAERKPSLG